MSLIILFSIFLYITTFVLGFYVDKVSGTNKKNWIRKCYIVWLFIFLCFGYMTGSDWRAYELIYQGIYEFRNEAEIGFWSLFELAYRMRIDFWLLAGILKCVYLYSFFRLAGFLSKKWMFTITALAMELSLLFMLVDYPMRFTTANIFINLSLIQLLQGRIKNFLLISVWAIFFHSTTVIIIVAALAFYYIPNKIVQVNKWIMLSVYWGYSLLVSNISMLNDLQQFLNLLLMDYGTKDYSVYAADDNNTFFTIGSLLNVLMGSLIIIFKDAVLKETTNVAVVKIVICYLFLFRFVMLLSAGFRFVIPFSIFAAYIVVVLLYKLKYKSGVLMVCIYTVTLVKSLFESYSYIPYSNSIPYIIGRNHLPYNERCDYNKNDYFRRTGKQIE